MRYAALILTSALLLQSSAFCADDDAKAAALPRAVADLVDLARTAPPELFANAVLQLSESGTIPAGDAQNALLQEAFEAAGRAQEPARLIPVPGIPPDTRAAMRAKAAEFGLDRLSLRLRAIKLLSHSDAPLARRLFESVPHPEIERPTCEDPLIPDASPYMEMAGIVAQTGFSPEERKDGRQIEFLQAILDGAKSPAEVAAFARALAKLSFSANEWQVLVASLATKLENIAPDYRSFTTSVASMRSPLEEFTFRAGQQKFDASELIRGFRSFLIQQMSGPRCDEDFGEGRPTVEWFNASFRGNLAPVDDQEIEPAQRQGNFVAEEYFGAPEAKRISDALNQLRKQPESERETPQWQAMLADFQRDFSSWMPAGADIDIFHQKFTILDRLLELVPPGTERDQLIAQCVGLLETSRMESLYPAEWLLEVKALGSAVGSDAAKLKDSFRSSGDSGLALFASL